MKGKRRERNGHDVVLQSGVREARRTFGGIDLPAALAGAMAALGVTVLLGAGNAVLLAVREDRGAATSDLWIAGAITSAAMLALAVLIGGWVAGRSARYDGTGNGWMSGLLFVALLGGTVAAGNWAENRWNLLNDVQAPTWISDPSRFAQIGVALIAVAAVILAAGLGGALGTRYHRRADALIATTQDDATMRDSNVAVVRDETSVRGEGEAEIDLTDYAGRHAVR